MLPLTSADPVNHIYRYDPAIKQQERARIKGQAPRVLWFTGLSGAGKSTIASLVEEKLHRLGRHTYLLDGDNLRCGLSKDLRFTDADRAENIRRAGEAAKLMVDAGEIFVDVPLDVAARRDPKGLYKRAVRGELENFTGIGSRYECPLQPELRIDAAALTPDAAAQCVVDMLRQLPASGAARSDAVVSLPSMLELPCHANRTIQ